MFVCLYVPPLVGQPAVTPHTLPGDVARASRGDLASLAREFSPRVEVHAPGLVTLDAHGLERLFGDATSLGQELRRAAAERGLPARIAMAPTRTAAWLVAHARAGLTIVEQGQQARWLSPLPLNVLEQLAANGLGPPVWQAPKPPLPQCGSRIGGSGAPGAGTPQTVADRVAGATAFPNETTASHNKPRPNASGSARSYRVRPTFHAPDTSSEARQPTGPGRQGRGEGEDRRSRAAQEQTVALLAVLKRWGLRTLGEFAALPPLALSERLGQHGLAWQRVARGEEITPLVPDAPEERFEETLELEWPIEGLQPLSFVFGRLFDALSARLLERDRAAAVLHIYLQLVTRQLERRVLQLPAPMRDARVLRTLALLNLEAHPVSAGIDRVTVVADPVPGRVIQCSLLTRALPFPEQMSTLLARLGAVMGEGHCGMAALVDSYRPGVFEMKPFTLAEWQKSGRQSEGALRLACNRPLAPFDFAQGAPSNRRGAQGWREAGATPGSRQSARTNESGSGIGDRGGLEPPTTQKVRPADCAGSRRTNQEIGLGDRRGAHQGPICVLRRFRVPIPASVTVQDGRPVRVTTHRDGLRGGPVQACAGPWRTSGEWWRVSEARVQADAERRLPLAVGWNRDEWDVNLADGVYRVYRDRDRDRWFVDGVMD